MNYIKTITNGIIKENPTFVLLLGMCPTLATTTSATNGMSMGLATMFVLICSNFVISLIKNVVPDMVRIPVFVVVIAAFVSILQMLMEAYMPSINKSLGIYIPLIVVNCIILGRAEMFACKNTVLDSALDGLGMGIGYILTMALMGGIRELIGSGTMLGVTIIPESIDRMTVMNSAPGGFFVFGVLMAGCVWLENKMNKPIERKSCGDVMLEEIDAAKAEKGKGGAKA